MQVDQQKIIEDTIKATQYDEAYVHLRLDLLREIMHKEDDPKKIVTHFARILQDEVRKKIRQLGWRNDKDIEAALRHSKRLENAVIYLCEHHASSRQDDDTDDDDADDDDSVIEVPPPSMPKKIELQNNYPARFATVEGVLNPPNNRNFHASFNILDEMCDLNEVVFRIRESRKDNIGEPITRGRVCVAVNDPTKRTGEASKRIDDWKKKAEYDTTDRYAFNQLIDLYFELLERQVNRVKCFTSQHTAVGLGLDGKGLRRYMLNIELLHRDQRWKYEYLFWAHNEALHWTLIVVNTNTRTITEFDSLSPNKDCSLHDPIEKYLQSVEEKHDITSPQPWKKQHVYAPQQSNNLDCGFCVMEYAKLLSLGIQPQNIYNFAINKKERTQQNKNKMTAIMREIRQRCIFEIDKQMLLLF